MLYGIIDVGSNSIRLCVYRAYENGKTIQLVHDQKVMAGLAGYVDPQGALSALGVSRAVEAIALLSEVSREQGAVELHVFATAVIRNASNSVAVAQAIEQACDIDLDVLTGRQEAYLGFIGAQRSIDADEGVFFDIGGGSTEVTLFSGGRIVHSASFPFGSLSMKVAHVAGILPREPEVRAIGDVVRNALREIPQFNGVESPRVYGVGGSVRAATRLLQELEDEDDQEPGVDAADLRGALAMLERDPEGVLEKVRQVAPDRVGTLFPGMAIEEALVSWFGAQRVVVATCGVREGYLRGVVLGQD